MENYKTAQPALENEIISLTQKLAHEGRVRDSLIVRLRQLLGDDQALKEQISSLTNKVLAQANAVKEAARDKEERHRLQTRLSANQTFALAEQNRLSQELKQVKRERDSLGSSLDEALRAQDEIRIEFGAQLQEANAKK